MSEKKTQYDYMRESDYTEEDAFYPEEIWVKKSDREEYFDYYDDMDAYPPAENARADAPGEPPAEDMPAQEDSGTEPGIPAQAAPGENTEAEVEIPETGGEDTDGKAED